MASCACVMLLWCNVTYIADTAIAVHPHTRSGNTIQINESWSKTQRAVFGWTVAETQHRGEGAQSEPKSPGRTRRRRGRPHAAHPHPVARRRECSYWKARVLTNPPFPQVYPTSYCGIHRLCWCESQLERSSDHQPHQVFLPIRDERHLLVEIQWFSTQLGGLLLWHPLMTDNYVQATQMSLTWRQTYFH